MFDIANYDSEPYRPAMRRLAPPLLRSVVIPSEFDFALRRIWDPAPTGTLRRTLELLQFSNRLDHAATLV
jgi:hypothetical protein